MIKQMTLSDLEYTTIEFLTNLRMLEGFDKHLFQRECELIADCANQLKNQDAIPKPAVSIFVDLPMAIMSAAEPYKPEKRYEIMLSADKLADLIRQCTQ